MVTCCLLANFLRRSRHGATGLPPHLKIISKDGNVFRVGPVMTFCCNFYRYSPSRVYTAMTTNQLVPLDTFSDACRLWAPYLILMVPVFICLLKDSLFINYTVLQVCVPRPRFTVHPHLECLMNPTSLLTLSVCCHLWLFPRRWDLHHCAQWRRK